MGAGSAQAAFAGTGSNAEAASVNRHASRRPGRMRALVAGFLIIALGLVTTVFVAWLAALLSANLVPLPEVLAMFDKGIQQDALHAGWRYSETEQVARIDRRGSAQSEEATMPHVRGAWKANASGLDDWSRFVAPPANGDHHVFELATGWPAKSLVGFIESRSPGTPLFAWRCSGALAGIQLVPGTGRYLKWFLPIRPLWLGIALNWMFWSAIWLAIALMPAARSSINRSYRRWRRWCPTCRYDMRAATTGICSECGRDRRERLPLFNRARLAFILLCLLALTGANVAAAIYARRTFDSLGIHWAAFNGDVEAVRAAIADGTDVNRLLVVRSDQMDQATPLMIAAYAGQTAVARALLDAGADVNMTSPGTGDNALVVASLGGHVEVVRLLLEVGAGPNARVSSTKPLWCAVWGGHRDVVEVLLKAGANVNDPQGPPPLIAAAKRGNIELIYVLVAAGAKIDAVRPSGSTPLMGTAMSGQVEALDLLITMGADVNAQNADGGRAIHCAPGTPNSATVIRRLVAAGADVDACTITSFTALMQAVIVGDLAAVEALLEAGADPTIVNDEGLRAEHIGENEAAEAIRRFRQHNRQSTPKR